VVVEGGPHGITWTHSEQVNQGLMEFLGEKKAAGRDNKEFAA
jgi:hypothetical protein